MWIAEFVNHRIFERKLRFSFENHVCLRVVSHKLRCVISWLILTPFKWWIFHPIFCDLICQRIKKRNLYFFFFKKRWGKGGRAGFLIKFEGIFNFLLLKKKKKKKVRFLFFFLLLLVFFIVKTIKRKGERGGLGNLACFNFFFFFLID